MVIHELEGLRPYHLEHLISFISDTKQGLAWFSTWMGD